jgi:2-polyprenyl-3-methyl-5-hydroxy-6-metoxy-1,4-benzoquinol methylase
MKCRSCDHILTHVLVDLQSAPPSNSYLSESDLNRPETYFPLKVMVCDKCFLVQVDEYEKSENIFNENYAYFSSYSQSWLEHSKVYSEKMISRFGLNQKSFVIEVASNDGYLLQYFKNKNIPCLGIDPTSSTAAVAREKGIETLENFFSESFAKGLSGRYPKADLIAGNNVLAHVPNLHDFVEGFRHVLNENGVVTLEFPHLMQLVQNNQFDTVYHEHFSYFSFSFVCAFFQKHGLRIFDVDELETHGGSLRIYACLEGANFKKEKSVEELLKIEELKGMTKLEYYNNFQERADQIKMTFLQFLLDAKKKGLKVAGYGAAAKGNTFINFAGVKHDLLSLVVDASPYKQGKYLPGSRVPIFSILKLREFNPDFIIIFPWNIKKEIIGQLRDQFKNSKFVTFIPSFEIID